jgi:SagB-type dehydrogenase family enzyme
LTIVIGERGRNIRVRRSPHLVLYWRNGRLLLRNYATAAIVEATPLTCRLLDACADWTTIDRLRITLDIGASPLLPRLIDQLCKRSFLHRADQRADPRERAMGSLDPWNPEAGFFHTATKHVRFWSPQVAGRHWRTRADDPMPLPVKAYRGVSRINLPPVNGSSFATLARERRTWRRFSSAPVSADELATLLGLSVGVQKWVRAGRRRLPLKTSPSGGARHPVEAYVVVRRVTGLRAGLYHYHAGRHALERLGRAPSAARLKAYMPASVHFVKASAFVFFTAVLERQLWRYPYSRAYRAALIEAGHVCQTFCLAATERKLAPFSLMGFVDDLIERDLGIDGITETVLYAAGVGRPPAGTTWAPRARGTLPVTTNPRMRDP